MEEASACEGILYVFMYLLFIFGVWGGLRSLDK